MSGAPMATIAIGVIVERPREDSHAVAGFTIRAANEAAREDMM